MLLLVLQIIRCTDHLQLGEYVIQSFPCLDQYWPGTEDTWTSL